MKIGYCVIVITNGFVYVGDVERDTVNNTIISGNARNIRKWGTSGGLHELVNTGPNKNSVVDSPAHVIFPWHSVISLHVTDSKLWKQK